MPAIKHPSEQGSEAVSSAEQSTAKLDRTGVRLSEEREQVLAQLTKESKVDAVKTALALLPTEPAVTSQDALINWIYCFRLLLPVKPNPLVTAEMKQRLAQTLINNLAALTQAPNTLIYQDYTLAWSVAASFINGSPDFDKQNTLPLKTWLLKAAKQINWNAAPAEGLYKGISAFWLLCSEEQWTIVRQLLERGADLDCNASPADGAHKGKSAFWQLCANKQWPIVRQLLERGADLDWNATAADGAHKGKSVFWLLCAWEQWAIVRQLLERGADLNWNATAADGPNKGISAFWLLCAREQWTIVRQLLKRGADLNWNATPADGPNKGKSAFWALCVMGKEPLELLSACLNDEAIVNLTTGNIHNTLLSSTHFWRLAARIRYHLFHTPVTELAITIEASADKQQSFLQNLLDQHPTLRTIKLIITPANQLRTLSKTTQAPGMTRYRQLQAACKELESLRKEEITLSYGELPKSFRAWHDNVTELDDKLWYWQELVHRYLKILLQVLQDCVYPWLHEAQLKSRQNTSETISASDLSAQVEQYYQSVAAIIKHPAIARLSYQAQAELNDMAYHGLLNQAEPTSARYSQAQLSYRTYYCYLQAVSRADTLAETEQEPLLRAKYQRQARALKEKASDMAILCQNHLLEAAKLGMAAEVTNALTSAEVEKLSQVFYEQMREPVSPWVTPAEATPVTISLTTLCDGLIKTYYEVPEWILYCQQRQMSLIRQQDEVIAKQQAEIAKLKTQLATLSQQVTSEQETKASGARFFNPSPQ